MCHAAVLDFDADVLSPQMRHSLTRASFRGRTPASQAHSIHPSMALRPDDRWTLPSSLLHCTLGSSAKPDTTLSASFTSHHQFARISPLQPSRVSFLLSFERLSCSHSAHRILNPLLLLALQPRGLLLGSSHLYINSHFHNSYPYHQSPPSVIAIQSKQRGFRLLQPFPLICILLRINDDQKIKPQEAAIQRWRV